MAARTEHPRAAEFEAQASRHLADCPFSVPFHLLPYLARVRTTSCICSTIRDTRAVRAEVFGEVAE